MHPEKSTFKPIHVIDRFLMDSSRMTIPLTESKKKTVLEIYEVALQQQAKVTITFLAKLPGKFSSIFIAVPLGKLH